MALQVAINGFGRIGRNFLRLVLQDPHARKALNIAVINVGSARLDMVAHMFKYDSLMGTYQDSVTLQGDTLCIGDYMIQCISTLTPRQGQWKHKAIDWVVDASGHYTERTKAEQHLAAGAHYVLITAPAHGQDCTIIPGVNDQEFNPKKHQIVSLGSCTTNAYVPLLKIINDAFGIERSFMTTVHAYTNSQVLLDVEGDDMRRSRAAALNIIPTSTGAMKVVEKILPELKGRIEAVAVRVPVANVSLLDLSFLSKEEVTTDAINRTCMRASAEALKGIVGICNEPLVSSDFLGDPHSVVVDAQLTATCGPTMGKVFGWYDNEWGYSARLKDFLVAVAHKA